MLFANKKEEVLDIQLTPHGRYLLSIGRLKPMYYSFHDENILYDGRYAGRPDGSGAIVEYAKDIEDRIQSDTPQMNTIASRVNRAKNAKRIFEPLFDLASFSGPSTHGLATIEQMSEQKFHLATNMIGNSAITSDEAPKWSVKVLNGEISGSVPHLTSSFHTLKIPQIDLDVFYNVAILNTDSAEGNSLPIDPDPVLNSVSFKDGTYIAVEPNDLLIEILEENVEYKNNNFEIEVFEMREDKLSTPRAGLDGSSSVLYNLKPLYFDKKLNLIKNNILLDKSEVQPVAEIGNNDSRMVKYYFDLNVDHEINNADICRAIETLDTKNIYVDLDVTCAPDIAASRFDIYSGPVTPPCPGPSSTTADDECATPSPDSVYTGGPIIDD